MGRRARTSAARMALAAMIVATACLADASAGHKLYDMSIFLRRDGAAAPSTALPSPAPTAADEQPVVRPLVWTGAALPLRAADRRPRGNPMSGIAGIVSELVAGFWRHDPEQDNNESDTLDLNAEIIFRKIRLFESDNPIAGFLLSPRPLIGGSYNNKKETHTAYAALNWRHVFNNDVFIAGSFGLAFHTGNLERPTRQCVLPEVCHLPGNRAFDDKRRAVTLGSRILFRQSVAMGYRFTRRHSISFYGAHISNGGLAKDNDGMNFVGIRYGYSLE